MTEKLPSYAWPGGYPLYYVSEGDALCPECANEFEHQLTRDADGKPLCAINWEDDSLFCGECGKRIESAYAEPEEN